MFFIHSGYPVHDQLIAVEERRHLARARTGWDSDDSCHIAGTDKRFHAFTLDGNVAPAELLKG
jgi:hypothetical protein